MMINNYIPACVKTVFYKVVAWSHVEVVRDILGFGQSIFGAIGLINLTREVYHFDRQNVSKASWKMTALKTIEVLGNISLVGGAATSYPIVQTLKRTAQWLFTPEQIARYFGPNAILSASRVSFVISVGTILFGMPSSIKTTYDIYCWLTKKVNSFEQSMQAKMTQVMATFTTVMEQTKF